MNIQEIDRHVGNRISLSLWAFRGFLILILIIPSCLFVLSGCTVDPEEENVRASIIKYFEGRDYRVSEIKIGKIEELPLGKREYMAPKKHVVSILLITLEPVEQSDMTGRKAVTFKEAVITIRRTGTHGVWGVDEIKGINLT